LYVTLLSAFQILLHRYTRQSEVVVGISSAGQALFDDASLVGHCVHFLPMLSVLPKTCTVKEHLAATRGQLLDAYDHQEFTYGTLLRKLPIQRDSSRLPLIEVQFNLEKLGTNLHFEGLQAEIHANPKGFVNTDLFLNIVETGDDLLLNCDYNTDLIDRGTLERWLASYTTILRGIAADPSREVENLDILEEDERKLVLDDWNRTAVDFGPFEPVYRTIERQAANSPNRVAVICDGMEWTYRQLNEYSNQLARHLRRQGIREGALVGVCLERSFQMLGAVLGVLKAGAAYLPLDPSHPAPRLELVLSDAYPGAFGLPAAYQRSGGLPGQRADAVGARERHRHGYRQRSGFTGVCDLYVRFNGSAQGRGHRAPGTDQPAAQHGAGAGTEQHGYAGLGHDLVIRYRGA
jgi:non-ribosomal peptide synthetase component F